MNIHNAIRTTTYPIAQKTLTADHYISYFGIGLFVKILLFLERLTKLYSVARRQPGSELKCFKLYVQRPGGKS